EAGGLPERVSMFLLLQCLALDARARERKDGHRAAWSGEQAATRYDERKLLWQKQVTLWTIL
ncbi:MAG TPA: hypothetical protein VIY29_12530, partial [Ktedonobacteraceae bacterium]